MDKHPTESKTYYQHFKLSQKRAMELFSHMCATVLHKGLCEKCQNHVAPGAALIAMINGYEEFASISNATGHERAYIMYSFGLLVHDWSFWLSLQSKYKKDDYIQTYNAVYTWVEGYINSINAPLN